MAGRPSTPSMGPMDEFRVVIAGGGVAALEAALTLADVAEGRARVELLAPEPQFWYRPTSVAEPFGLATVRHFDLGLLGARAGAGVTLGALTGVDADRRVASTASGAEVRYDALLIACGAVPTTAVPGALTFRGPADGPKVRTLLDELEQGVAEKVAFVVPAGSAWPLPAYELALMTARHLEAGEGSRSSVFLVTPESRPLQIFGRVASDAVGEMLAEAGVAVVPGAHAVSHDGRALLLADGSLEVDRTVALPRLRGVPIEGLPQTAEYFVPVDDHCAVIGVDGVFAAGDITAFTIKQGGIAAQQAVAAAEAIAVLAGATLFPRPFRPVLRGLLLTGGEPAYLRHDLAEGGGGDWASGAPIWWPPTKIVGRRLTPFLAFVAGESEAREAEPPPVGGVPVDIPIDRETGDTLSVGLGF
jgi:sulfide:quinone oxidoreductase